MKLKTCSLINWISCLRDQSIISPSRALWDKVNVEYIFSVNKTKKEYSISLLQLKRRRRCSEVETKIVRLERKWSTRYYSGLAEKCSQLIQTFLRSNSNHWTPRCCERKRELLSCGLRIILQLTALPWLVKSTNWIHSHSRK